MKKILFALTICLSAVFNASAQNDALEYQLIGSESDTLAAAAPNEYLKVDTIDYLSDQVQNLFFSAHVGLSLSMSENTRFTNFFAVTRPSFRFSVGKFFYPQFGLRGSIEYLNQRGRIEWESAELCEEYATKYPDSDCAKYGDKGNYDFSMLGGFLDGMIDFHNVIWKYKENRRFHLIGYFGLGAFYTFGFNKDQLKHYMEDHKDDNKMHALPGDEDIFDGLVTYITLIDTKENLQPIFDVISQYDTWESVLQEDVYWKDYWLEICPKGATKAKAILKCMKNCNCESVVVFGDSVNDLSMFEVADEAYAVANALPEVKDKATKIIDSNENDGVAKFLMDAWLGKK